MVGGVMIKEMCVEPARGGGSALAKRRVLRLDPLSKFLKHRNEKSHIARALAAIHQRSTPRGRGEREQEHAILKQLPLITP